MNTKELQEYHDRFDVIRSMDSFVSEAVDDKLMNYDDCWQPNDFYQIWKGRMHWTRLKITRKSS